MRNGTPEAKRLQQLAKAFVLWLARNFGTRLADSRTGEPIGRVFIIPWKGKLAIFGLTKAVRPEFAPQTRVTYARQDLAFHIVPEPNYPNVRSTDHSSHASKA
jgi:hypothetical protein